MCLARWSCLRHVCGRAMFARKMVTLSIPLPRLCWCCVLCAIFGAFLLIYAKLWHFSIAFSLVLQDLLLLLLQLRLLCLASFRLHMPRFASSSPRVRLVRRMFVSICVRSIQFPHICATLLSNVQHIATFIVVVLVLLCC